MNWNEIKTKKHMHRIDINAAGNWKVCPRRHTNGLLPHLLLVRPTIQARRCACIEHTCMWDTRNKKSPEEERKTKHSIVFKEKMIMIMTVIAPMES